jgi:Flp pilus assembly protein TadG
MTLLDWIRETTKERGTAVVEMALVLPILIALAFGIGDFGVAMNRKNDATHMANLGARLAAVNANPGAASSQTLQDYVLAQGDTASLRDSSKTQVCVTFPDGTGAVGHPVEVDVKTSYQWLPYFVKQGYTTKSLVGRAVMRLEQTPTNFSPSNNSASC